MSHHHLSQWQWKVAALAIEGRAWIDDGYSTAENDRAQPCIKPATSKQLTDIVGCTEADVRRAVSLAHAAFERGDWSRSSPAERRAVLSRLAGLIATHAEELALLETLAMGNPIGDPLALNPTPEQGRLCHAGAISPQTNEVLATVTREQLGVVAVVVPQSVPMIFTCWKLAPVLAIGNSVIIKPSEQSSLSALRLAALATEAGIPDGVFQILHAGQTPSPYGDCDGQTVTDKRFMAYRPRGERRDRNRYRRRAQPHRTAMSFQADSVHLYPKQVPQPHSDRNH